MWSIHRVLAMNQQAGDPKGASAWFGEMKAGVCNQVNWMLPEREESPVWWTPKFRPQSLEVGDPGLGRPGSEQKEAMSCG